MVGLPTVRLIGNPLASRLFIALLTRYNLKALLLTSVTTPLNNHGPWTSASEG